MALVRAALFALLSSSAFGLKHTRRHGDATLGFAQLPRRHVGDASVDAPSLFERNNDTPELPVDYSEAWAAAGPDAVNLSKLDTPEKLRAALGRESKSWIKREGNKLTLDGQVFRFHSLADPYLDQYWNPFEVDDTFKSLGAGFGNCVTRPYVFKIKSVNVVAKSAHVNAWLDDQQRWNLTEDMMVRTDTYLAKAAQYGCRVFIPIINQRHPEASNYAGDTHDLIALRYGITNKNDTEDISFWRDPVIVDAFKILIDQLLNRVNSINGIKWGEDPTVLAWETGNELQDDDGALIFNSTLPAPGNWTVDIAKHIKSIAPNALVMDGSYSRNKVTEKGYATEALEDPAVDLLSFHGYGDGDMERFPKDGDYVTSHGKAYIAGEIGFASNSTVFDKAYDAFLPTAGTGTLAWSFRPHAYKGGFVVHSEGFNGIFSYHVPGFAPPLDPENFDVREASIIASIRNASYAVVGQKTPSRYPIPGPSPALWYNATSSGGTGLIWKGAAWAKHYQLWTSCNDCGQQWKLLNDSVYDFIAEDKLIYPLSDRVAKQCALSLVAVSVDGAPGLPSSALRPS